MNPEIWRRSPVSFDRRPAQTETRDNWMVVLKYEDESEGPYLIDLSPRTRWDVQDSHLAEIRPGGVPIPDKPGQCTFQKGILVNRMNRTQAAVWHLTGETPEPPAHAAYTDVTESTVFLALVGRRVFAITEKLTSLDFLDPARSAPFLLQGPFSHVPCQVVTLEKSPDRAGILLTCSRGYARDLVAAILDAGEEFGLRPAGQIAFHNWLEELGY
ncbi:MAG: sarcosine oxidase subunit gamma SoxG [Desulfobacterales bacterium]|nr:MAG: sarcosine oxidase subunit gamma SoxG [Desulfobacterales bacterium]